MNIQAQFPETTGLRYRLAATSPWRAIKRVEPPRDGWGEQTYFVVKRISGIGLGILLF